jgi:2-polyprenyl-3-methyl-5-hydroxy-6-metoxy-1,4-benzoquinol methylase
VKPYTLINIDQCAFCGGGSFNVIAKPIDFRVSQQIFPVVKCASCGHAFTNPRPADADLGMFYESDDYISHTNSSKGVFNRLYKAVRSVALKQKRKLVEYHQPQKGLLLDIGCGTGEFLHQMQTAGWQVEGVEEAALAREQAQQKYELNVVEGKAVFEKESAAYSAITLWHVLEHLPDLNAYFQLFQRLLQTEGKLVIAVPNHESFDAAFYKDDWAAWDVPIHISHFSKRSMVQWAEKFGFHLIETRNMPFDGFYVSMLSERIRKRPLSFVRGANLGLVSNMRAAQNNASSLIYVFTKKPV